MNSDKEKGVYACSILSAYELHMLLHGELPWLPRVQYTIIDGVEKLTYDVEQLVSVKDYGKAHCFKSQEITAMLNGVLHIMKTSEDMLFCMNSLIFSPEELYFDSRARKLFCLYVPGYQKMIGEQIKELLEFLLLYADYTESEGGSVLHSLYDTIVKEGFSAERVRACLEQGIRGDFLLPAHEKPDLSPEKEAEAEQPAEDCFWEGGLRERIVEFTRHFVYNVNEFVKRQAR